MRRALVILSIPAAITILACGGGSKSGARWKGADVDCDRGENAYLYWTSPNSKGYEVYPSRKEAMAAAMAEGCRTVQSNAINPDNGVIGCCP